MRQKSAYQRSQYKQYIPEQDDEPEPLRFKNGSKVIVPPPPLEFTDAVDILHANYPPRQWIIPDILPIGLTSLVAKGKVGKSLTLLEMCINLVQPVDGKILYLDLEGDDLLLQERMRDILQGNELARDRLYFTHQAANLSNGLLEQLSQALREHPGTVMLVIDVYGIVQAARTEADVYHSDSKIWTELHNFAHKHRIALVVLHHTNKRQNVDDPFDLISGSTGISGSCDAQWCLLRKRNTTKAQLYVSGRAIVMDIMVEFELGDFSGAFKVMREDDGPEITTSEQAIVRVLHEQGEPLSPKRIAELAKMGTSRMAVRRMLAKGLLIQTAYGLYDLPARVTKSHRVTESNNLVTLYEATPQAGLEARVTESQQHAYMRDSVTLGVGQPVEPVYSNGKSNKKESAVTLVTLERPMVTLVPPDDPFWSNEPVGQDTWYNAPPPEPEYTLSGEPPPTSPEVEALPRCPSCRHNKRVHHNEFNEYGCNSCGSKFHI